MGGARAQVVVRRGGQRAPPTISLSRDASSSGERGGTFCRHPQNSLHPRGSRGRRRPDTVEPPPPLPPPPHPHRRRPRLPRGQAPPRIRSDSASTGLHCTLLTEMLPGRHDGQGPSACRRRQPGKGGRGRLGCQALSLRRWGPCWPEGVRRTDPPPLICQYTVHNMHLRRAGGGSFSTQYTPTPSSTRPHRHLFRTHVSTRPQRALPSIRRVQRGQRRLQGA